MDWCGTLAASLSTRHLVKALNLIPCPACSAWLEESLWFCAAPACLAFFASVGIERFQPVHLCCGAEVMICSRFRCSCLWNPFFPAGWQRFGACLGVTVNPSGFLQGPKKCQSCQKCQFQLLFFLLNPFWGDFC